MTACVKYNRLVYLEKGGKDGVQYDTYQTPAYHIRPYDILSVELKSLEQNNSQYFDNPFNTEFGRTQNSSAYFYYEGYIVDEEGYIDLPMLGKLEVKGMTTEEIKKKVDEGLSEYMKFASVSVKLLNYRVTVFGEVNAPGVQYIYEKKFTILQALAQAGSLTEFADSKHIKLVRESEEGTKIVYLDLTRPEIVSSEYFFLKPNDVIYIEPTRSRAFNINSRVLTLTLSITSIGLAILTFINN